jgi:hypothetical protein
VDVNASLYFMTGSGNNGGQSASASGYAGVLRVALSTWLGADTSTAAARNSDADNEESSQPPGQAPKATRLSLDLQEGRRLLLTTNGTENRKKLKLTLLKAPYATQLSTCRTVAIHAPKRDDVTLTVAHTRISAPSGDLTALSAEIDIENLKSLTIAPITTAVVFTPDHWIDVCGQHWPISPLGRRQLQEYLEGL